MTIDPRLFPTPADLACIYVVEIDRRVKHERIKVGYTGSPKTRVGSHKANALAHGCVPDRAWVSQPGSGTDELEDKLIAYCAQHAKKQIKREYFAGISYDDVVAYAIELTRSFAPAWPHAEALASRLRAVSSRESICLAEVARFLEIDRQAAEWLASAGAFRPNRFQAQSNTPRVMTLSVREWLETNPDLRELRRRFTAADEPMEQAS